MGDSQTKKLKPSNVGKPAARKKARRFLLQAMYQWQLAKTPIDELEEQFRTDFDMKKADIEYFHDVLQGIPQHVNDLDRHIEPYLDRRLDELDPIELGILRIAVYELTQRVDVPYKVVINEAVELAKLFGATDGHKYVNGVLDKLAQKLRVMEFKHNSKDSQK
ncbi:MAG: transcription antitermination factor NusB [Pseudomonadales bacterium]|nr:transcription antitermination factor NusB [Pseudomonadales bacterium]